MKTLKHLLNSSVLIGLMVATPVCLAAKEPDTTNTDQTLSLPLKDIQRFATAVAQIKRYYIEPVSDEKLFNYAIEGMLSNLDPHSSYLNKEDMEDLQMITTGEFGGIGIEVIPEDGFIKVISPIDDTPAYKAGIKPGDLIVKIDNKLVNDMSLREAIDLIRGPSGSKINLTIVRKGTKKPLSMTLTREIIKVNTVKSKILNNNYAYIRIAFFQNNTYQDMINAINKIKKETDDQLYGIIIDLRNDPGGLLDSAIDVANAFIDSKKAKYEGLIVYTKGRIPENDVKAKAKGNDVLPGVPMVILVNGGSASASEIVAGALQDQKRAIILGTKSFGKGSVQTVLPIDYTSGIKLTTALYYTPSGHSIQAKGIIPDVLVPELKIPSTTTDTDESVNIEEADLQGHLNNADAPTKDVTKKVPGIKLKPDEITKSTAQEDAKLIQTDYQLYEALNLLKAMHASRH